jgi:hypothetical protein
MWQEIEFLPELYSGSKRMFVVKGVGLPLGSANNYSTDPYCVWKMTGDNHYARWPFEYPPTHFMELPEKENEGYLVYSSDNIFYSKLLLKEACEALGLDFETSSWFDVVGAVKNQAQVMGELYQILGVLDASEKVLDQVLAASEGKPLPYETLLAEPFEE